MNDIISTNFKRMKYVGIVENDDRAIVLSIYSMQYINLNPLALLIFKMLDKGYTPDQIIQQLYNENPEINRNTIETDVFDCCNEFLDKKLFSIA